MDTGISPPQKEPGKALTPEQEASPLPSRWLSVLALVAGLAVLALGLLAGGLFTLLSLINQQEADALAVTTLGLSIAALGLGFGGALAWIGYDGLQRRPARPFRPGMRWFWGCLGGLGLALPIGQVIISFDLLSPVIFPLFHVLGVALPAVAILILVGRMVGNNIPPPTQRQVVGEMVLGALGTTAISFTLEAVMAVLGVVLVGMIVALTPGGMAQLIELQTMLANPGWLQDPQMLARWLLKPGVLLPVAAMLVVVAPMIEEGAKSIGVPLLALGTGAKPTPAQGWLWGIAVGAGFAVAEGLFNSAANLPFWAGIALLRIGATAMHLATAGLTGLGWTRTLASRQPWSILGSYLLSVMLHSLWNGTTVLMVVSSLWAMAEPGEPGRMLVTGPGIVAGLAGLIFITITTTALAVYITLRVRRTSE